MSYVFKVEIWRHRRHYNYLYIHKPKRKINENWEEIILSYVVYIIFEKNSCHYKNINTINLLQ